jgi:hypothetical protein
MSYNDSDECVTAVSNYVPPFQSQDQQHIRAGYALLAILLFLALVGFICGLAS